MDPLAQALIVFTGLMALLGCVTKILLTAVRAFENRRSGSLPGEAMAMLREMSERLTRVEQGVETTAVEVERMAEGQRFTAKLLAERNSRPAEQGLGDASRSRVITPH